MRAHWSLPEESLFRYTGPDWLLLLLAWCSSEQGDLTKLVQWRARTVHNNIMHQSGPSQVDESVSLLLSMRTSIEQSRQQYGNSSLKGKEPCRASDNRTRSMLGGLYLGVPVL
jgi:hypothetical protein